MHCLWVVLGESPSHFSLRMPARSAPAQNVFVTPPLPQPQSQMESGNPPLCKEERTGGHCPRVTAGMVRKDPGGLASSGETYKLPTGVWGSRWQERGKKPLLDADSCPDPGRQGSVPWPRPCLVGKAGRSPAGHSHLWDLPFLLVCSPGSLHPTPSTDQLCDFGQVFNFPAPPAPQPEV